MQVALMCRDEVIHLNNDAEVLIDMNSANSLINTDAENLDITESSNRVDEEFESASWLEFIPTESEALMDESDTEDSCSHLSSSPKRRAYRRKERHLLNREYAKEGILLCTQQSRI